MKCKVDGANIEILSNCCNSTITVGMFASRCDECGNSVSPDDGKHYSCKTESFGGVNL